MAVPPVLAAGGGASTALKMPWLCTLQRLRVPASLPHLQRSRCDYAWLGLVLQAP